MKKLIPAARVRPGISAAKRLYGILSRLHDEMLKAEADAAEELKGIAREQRASARNLIHYLALRKHDLRTLQRDLAELGLSSLGRCEAHTLASVDSVVIALRALLGLDQASPLPVPPVNHRSGPLRLDSHASTLFGAAPANRLARIMVTLPSEAASDPQLIDSLFRAGMDLARINCAHDDATVWRAMIGHLRQASRRHRHPCRILMDLAGPKLRTGPIAPGDQVVSWRPQRDHRGRVVHPAWVALIPTHVKSLAKGSSQAEGSSPPENVSQTEDNFPSGVLAPPECAAVISVASQLIELGRPGDVIELMDARAKRRRLTVIHGDGNRLILEATTTAYVQPGTRLRLMRKGKAISSANLGELPPLEQPLILMLGDHLQVTAAQEPGQPAQRDAAGQLSAPARIPCSMPEVLAEVRPGERIWLDDGKIGGVVRIATADMLTVEITQVKASGARLRADKGINLPDSSLTLPCLDADDLANLHFACRHADLVGLSFIRRPQDIDELITGMGTAKKRPGIILKVETPQAFTDLSGILLRALDAGPIGVMVARGDLAVEVGFARIAEVQEEILWLCEAAHVPVIWGTQVLESLAKKGLATRAEVTDAAMSVRAECVMLNKGPYVVNAVSFLDDVLTRMQGHQSKKQTLLRSLAVSHRPTRAR